MEQKSRRIVYLDLKPKLILVLRSSMNRHSLYGILNFYLPYSVCLELQALTLRS